MMINDETSIAANATVANVLTGSVFEFIPFNALLQIGLVAAATGLQITVSSGSDILMQESPVSIQNRFPLFQEDFPLEDVAAQGERLTIRARNTTGAAIILFTTVRITPV